MVSGGRLDVLEQALFQILQSSIVCVNGGVFSATSSVPVVIDSSSQLLLAGGNVGLTSGASLSVNNAVLWLASGSVSFSTGALLQLTASELQILGGQLIITGTAKFVLQSGSKVRIMSGELDFLGTTQPIVTSGSEIDIGDFVPLASNPLCPFSGTPLPGPGVVKVDGSSVLKVDQNSVVTVRNGTFNVTSSGTVQFIDARLDVYQVGLVVAELTSNVQAQNSNVSVSGSGSVVIQDNAEVQLGSQSNLAVSGSGTVTFTGTSVSNLTGSAMDVTGGVVTVDQNAIVGMSTSTGSVSNTGTLNVNTQGELDVFGASGLTVGSGGNVNVGGSGYVNIDSSTIDVSGGTVSITSQVNENRNQTQLSLTQIRIGQSSDIEWRLVSDIEWSHQHGWHHIDTRLHLQHRCNNHIWKPDNCSKCICCSIDRVTLDDTNIRSQYLQQWNVSDLSDWIVDLVDRSKLIGSTFWKCQTEHSIKPMDTQQCRSIQRSSNECLDNLEQHSDHNLEWSDSGLVQHSIGNNSQHQHQSVVRSLQRQWQLERGHQ